MAPAPADAKVREGEVSAIVARSVRSAADAPIKVSVNATKVLAPNDRFWASAVFHPTEYFDLPMGQERLALMAESGAVSQYVRLYSQPEDALRVRADGSIHYDWSHFDRRAEAILAHGLTPMVAMFSMPSELASDPAVVKRRLFLGREAPISPPRDYAEWGALCADFARHVLRRFGEAEVLRWRFTCWNEPDLVGFWKDGDVGAYLPLYDHFAAAFRSVHPGLKIGGPSCSSTRLATDATAFRWFLSHIAQGRNFVTGGIGSPIDFITIHTYGGTGGGPPPGHNTVSLRFMIDLQLKLAALRDVHETLRSVPIYVAEWGEASGGTTGVRSRPTAAVRNSQYGAAFLGALVGEQLRLRELPVPPRIEGLMFCPSGYEGDRTVDFQGFRTYETRNGIHKPILNAYRLLARLGTDFVAITSDRVGPAVELRAGPMLYAYATRGSDGNVSVALIHFDETAMTNEGPPVAVEVELRTGWWANETIETRHWRIDEARSNAYTVFREMGEPEQPSSAQLESLRSRMGLEELIPPVRGSANAASITTVSLPVNSVSLLEFRTVDEPDRR